MYVWRGVLTDFFSTVAKLQVKKEEKEGGGFFTRKKSKRIPYLVVCLAIYWAQRQGSEVPEQENERERGANEHQMDRVRFGEAKELFKSARCDPPAKREKKKVV